MVANGDDQLEYSSISSRESLHDDEKDKSSDLDLADPPTPLHDENDKEKSSDLDLVDPPTPTASAGSSANGPAKETDLPKGGY